jgi:hypothetical protein
LYADSLSCGFRVLSLLRDRRAHRVGRLVEREHRRRGGELGRTHLQAAGLGAYIAEATEKGDHPRVVLGIVVMAVFVVVFNRVVWRPLYRLSERRFRLS